jgi:uncharacterized SAM-binding protein YcdF (DUF218 family)
MIYLIKQCVGALLTPLAFALLLTLLGGTLWFWRRRRAARWLFAGAAATAYLGAIAPVGDALIGTLERQNGPPREVDVRPSVEYIVVLGSSYTPRAGVPVTGALDDEGLARVVEGVRLMRLYSIPHLVLSGGSPEAGAEPAVGYAVLATSLGVSSSAQIVLPNALDTAGEARATAGLLGSTPFILVTSASHMPRALRLMRRAGARPIPAPTRQRALEPRGFDARRWLPNAVNLRKTERALHEYAGLLALRIEGS